MLVRRARNRASGGSAAVRAGRGSGPATSFALALLLLLSVLVLVPIVAMVYGATRTNDLGEPGGTFTLEPLREAFTNGRYLVTIGGTLVISCVVAIVCVGVGAAFAWVLSRTNVPGKKTLEMGLIAPLFLSPFVGAIAWVTLAAENSGMLNVNLRHIFGQDFTLVDVQSTGGLLWVLCLYYIPYGYLFVSAALKNMDPALEDASYVNGLGHIQTALRVTFPIIRPAMAAAFFFVAVSAMGIFSVPGVLAIGGGFRPIAVEIFREAQVYPTDFSMAAALSTVVLLLTIVGIFLYRRAVADAAKYVTVSSRGFRPRVIDIGRVRYVVVAAVALYGFLSVVLPYAALVLMALNPYTIPDLTAMHLTLDNVVNALTSTRILESLRNTIALGVMAPTIACIIALAVAQLVHRTDTRLRMLVDYLATLPIAIPGIVLAAGMVWAYIRTPLYGTLAILLIAYVASYLPNASLLVTNGLTQIDRSLEEAAWVSGAGRGRAALGITLPLVMPAIFSAWIMVFIFTVREINAAIMLYSPRSTVLSVLTWDYIETGSIQYAAVVGLLQTCLLLAGVVVARYVLRVRLSVAI